MIKLNLMESLINNLKKFFYYTLPFIFCIIGLLIFFHPLLESTNHMPGDLGDARLVNYILEHGYLWLTKAEVHKSFWDMPFFYPYKNTLAYSDFFIGGMIIYSPIRFFVNSPQTAMQIWSIILCILNFLSCYIFMVKIFKFKNLPASTASFLFAFGLPRHIQIVHFQTYMQFLMMFSLTAFFSVNKNNSNLKNNILFLIGTVMFVLELYSSFYLGWFMVFGSFIGLIIGFAFKDIRKILLEKIKLYRKELIFYAILALFLLIPLIQHYLAVGAKFNWISSYLIKYYSFFYSESAINCFFAGYTFPKKLNCETTIGLGYFTTVITILGLLNFKHRKKIFLFIGIILLCFSSKIVNYILYNCFPGAVAIRAAGRAIFLLLPLFALGLASFIKKYKKIAILVAILVLLEQIPYKSRFDWNKLEHQNRLRKYTYPQSCKVIFYEGATIAENIDIMWLSSNNNIYTVNGYTGYMPKYLIDDIPKNCIMKIH